MAESTIIFETIFVLILLFNVIFSSANLGPPGHNFKEENSIEEKVCIGTNGRMSVPSNRDHHYRNLRDRYTNCTYIDGNLELTWLQDPNIDLSFLQHIREVTGYVLISHVDVKRIVLPKLQIIRGRTLFSVAISNEHFALMATLSKAYSLELPSLRDIISGSVGILNNYNLCHINTINWKEIISSPIGKQIFVYNFTSPERECECDKSCEAGCWGEGPQNCQKFSKENCSPQCDQGRCFGPNPRECCHLFCAGGCKGPKQSDCLACKNFYDNGTCTQECPPMQRYNSITYSWESNPDGKYAYGATCVKKCPEHLLKDNGACVRSCPEKKKAENGECIPCVGPCPKNCKGGVIVHSGNINSFKNCTIIEGFLQILEQSFTGFQEVYSNYSFGARYETMHPDKLEVFSTVKEVTEFISIQAFHEAFTNLSYFRNLETIGGRTLGSFNSALYIVKTSLRSLRLRSLKQIHAGSINILENKNLCFADKIDWSRFKNSKNYATMLQNNKDAALCEAEGQVCNPECSKHGCWDVGDDQCLSCANYSLGTQCLQDCNTLEGLYKASATHCERCHKQCKSTCHGPEANHCDSCRNVKDGPFCVEKCPISKYVENGICKNCHENCHGGCTGPRNTIGPGGCNSCERAIINSDMKAERCLHPNDSCPDGYYYEWVGPQEQGLLKSLAGKAICRKCHPRCKKCTGYGFHEQFCQECMNYKRDEQCEDECPVDHYADNSTHMCIQCHSECRGCTGPGDGNCNKCRNYKLFKTSISLLNSEKNITIPFRCIASCPPDSPYKIFPQHNVEPYCSKVQIGIQLGLIDNQKTPAVLAAILVCAILVLIFLAYVSYQWRRKAMAKETAMKMTMALTGLEDNEPLRPTNVQPNLAKLRIVKEAELRRGGILGKGAFGVVFKGVWVPEGENAKIPVAIKVLREGTSSNTSKEFLEEAYIMATVEHPNLLQLLAVCMTEQLMLVTQLMPLGCLLHFVQSHRERIGSKALLNWCTQIARGMSYLEEKRLVHRDLAARNVLVQTPSCVKITDFGLAKLLDINEEEYKAPGGKMPIKWLALECIQHRIFTHKSDVWAFGVTVWELLTYGGRPYEQISVKDVPELLEKGERLPQPNICTIDVYMIMIKCWMLDAESRPCFKELADEFAKMARDPGRYLVIPGDKFMRLPQFSQDPKDHLYPVGGSINMDSLGDTDEYLQPKSRAPISISTTTSSSPPLTPLKPGWPTSEVSEEGYAPQNQHNMHKERYPGVHGFNPHHVNGNGIMEPGSTTNRYCSDPLKLLGVNEFNLKEDDDSGSSGKREAQVGTIKLSLPLDEDDYLMPSPQQPQGVSTYMDLIGDSNKHIDSQVASNSGYGNYPDFLPQMGQTEIDNPEYLMAPDTLGIPTTPTQTLGIPTISEMITAANTNVPSLSSASSADTTTTAIVNEIQRPVVGAQKSIEEESDHEYYNDFDRLQRELQPLRKSETTV